MIVLYLACIWATPVHSTLGTRSFIVIIYAWHYYPVIYGILCSHWTCRWKWCRTKCKTRSRKL